MSKSFVSTFAPDVYYGEQAAAGSQYYPVFQGGRGFGSLFKAAKNMALPFMKNIVLPVIKDEAGQLIQDVTSGKGLKASLKNSAKRAGKRVITKSLTGKGRKKTKKRQPAKKRQAAKIPRKQQIKINATDFINKLPFDLRKKFVAASSLL